MSLMKSYDARTGMMDFSLALIRLKQGAKIRRRYWPHSMMVVYEGGVLTKLDGAWKVSYSADQSDLLASDWDEVIGDNVYTLPAKEKPSALVDSMLDDETWD